MGVRITDSENVALYDSVTGVAFGPVFDDEDQADEFLKWLKVKYEAKETFEHGNETLYFLDDPRTYRHSELAHAVGLFLEQEKETGDEN